jgi:hypothetical protein
MAEGKEPAGQRARQDKLIKARRKQGGKTMKKLHCNVMIAVLALAAVVPVKAQYESLENGNKVRIHTRAAEGLPVSVSVGLLNGRYDDRLILVDDFSNETAIRQDQIMKVEYLRGTRRHTLSGLLLGVLVGGAAGVLFHELTYTKPKPSDNWLIDGFVAPMAEGAAYGSALLIGSAAGGVIGIIVGSGSITEQWEVVPRVNPDAPIAGTGMTALSTPRVGLRINL